MVIIIAVKLKCIKYEDSNNGFNSFANAVKATYEVTKFVAFCGFKRSRVVHQLKPELSILLNTIHALLFTSLLIWQYLFTIYTFG
ncbi:hypothetical protein PIPA1_39190 [Pelosinus sp. IPA-1]|nr:hypothetical protein PIPA1_39190 [Pelosinus sp. IPA-1]